MNKNIIQFYMLTHNLKEKLRTGWQEIKVSSERLESVAEHVYGCLMLAIAIDSEYKLDVDMNKVLKMLSLHELEETIMNDFTIRSDITPEEKLKMGKECVLKATNGMNKQKGIVELLDEYNARETKEAIFSYHVDKIENDFQVKYYDLKGGISLDNMLEDLSYYVKDLDELKNKMNHPSDGWLEVDKPLFIDDKIFESLINDIQRIEEIND